MDKLFDKTNNCKSDRYESNNYKRRKQSIPGEYPSKHDTDRQQWEYMDSSGSAPADSEQDSYSGYLGNPDRPLPQRAAVGGMEGGTVVDPVQSSKVMDTDTAPSRYGWHTYLPPPFTSWPREQSDAVATENSSAIANSGHKEFANPDHGFVAGVPIAQANQRQPSHQTDYPVNNAAAPYQNSTSDDSFEPPKWGSPAYGEGYTRSLSDRESAADSNRATIGDSQDESTPRPVVPSSFFSDTHTGDAHNKENEMKLDSSAPQSSQEQPQSKRRPSLAMWAGSAVAAGIGAMMGNEHQKSQADQNSMDKTGNKHNEYTEPNVAYDKSTSLDDSPLQHESTNPPTASGQLDNTERYDSPQSVGHHGSALAGSPVHNENTRLQGTSPTEEQGISGKYAMLGVGGTAGGIAGSFSGAHVDQLAAQKARTANNAENKREGDMSFGSYDNQSKHGLGNQTELNSSPFATSNKLRDNDYPAVNDDGEKHTHQSLPLDDKKTFDTTAGYSGVEKSSPLDSTEHQGMSSVHAPERSTAQTFAATSPLGKESSPRATATSYSDKHQGATESPYEKKKLDASNEALPGYNESGQVGESVDYSAPRSEKEPISSSTLSNKNASQDLGASSQAYPEYKEARQLDSDKLQSTALQSERDASLQSASQNNTEPKSDLSHANHPQIGPQEKTEIGNMDHADQTRHIDDQQTKLDSAQQDQPKMNPTALNSTPAAKSGLGLANQSTTATEIKDTTNTSLGQSNVDKEFAGANANSTQQATRSAESPSWHPFSGATETKSSTRFVGDGAAIGAALGAGPIPVLNQWTRNKTSDPGPTTSAGVTSTQQSQTQSVHPPAQPLSQPQHPTVAVPGGTTKAALANPNTQNMTMDAAPMDHAAQTLTPNAKPVAKATDRSQKPIESSMSEEAPTDRAIRVPRDAFADEEDTAGGATAKKTGLFTTAMDRIRRLSASHPNDRRALSEADVFKQQHQQTTTVAGSHPPATVLPLMPGPVITPTGPPGATSASAPHPAMAGGVTQPGQPVTQPVQKVHPMEPVKAIPVMAVPAMPARQVPAQTTQGQPSVVYSVPGMAGMSSNTQVPQPPSASGNTNMAGSDAAGVTRQDHAARPNNVERRRSSAGKMDYFIGKLQERRGSVKMQLGKLFHRDHMVVEGRQLQTLGHERCEAYRAEHQLVSVR